MNDLHSLILEHVQEIVYAVRTNVNSPQGTVQFVGKRTESLLGYKPQEFIENPDLWVSIMHPDDREKVRRTTQEMYQTGKPVKRIYRVRHKTTGRYLWLEDNPSPLVDKKARVTGHIGVAREVTDRMHAEQQRNLAHAIAVVLAGAGNAKDTIASILKMVCTTLSWDEGELWIVDPQFNVLRCDEIWSDPTLALAEFVRITREITFAPGRGLPGRIWASRQPHWIPDVLKDPNFPRSVAATTNSLHGGFGFPIAAEGRVIGVACFFSKEIRQPNTDLLEMFNTIGSQMGQFMQRKQTEEALRESEKLLRESQLVAGLGSYVQDIRTGMWKSSEVLDNIFGIDHTYTRSVEGWVSLVHPDWRDTMLRYFKDEVLAKNIRFDKKYKIIRQKDGQARWVHGLGDLEFDAQHRPVKMTGTIIDITEREQTEEALHNAEARYRAIFEQSPDGVLLIDVATGKTIEANETAYRQLGYTRDEFTTLRISDYDMLEKQEETAQRMQKVSREGSDDFETLHRTKTGEIRNVHVWTKTLQLSERVLFYSIFQDITERKRAEEALSESEKRFHQLFDEAPVGYHALDIHGRIIEVNRTELEMLGYTAEEMLGHPVWEFIVDREASREAVTAKMAGSIPSDQTYERIFRRKDGRTLEVLIKDRSFRGGTGEVVGIRSTVQDVTEQRGAERELRLMAQALISTKDCISITDLENRLIFVNDSFLDAYGYTADELLGKNISMVRSSKMPNETKNRPSHLPLQSGWYGEIMDRRKDGSEFPVEVWTSLVKDDAGLPVAIVGVARDITQRKLAEDKLRQSEEQFRLISENVADMIAVLDLDGKRIYNSPSYESILGDPKALKGTDGFQEIHPDDRERIRQAFQETVRTGIGQQMEYRFLLKDGSEHNIESKGSAIREDDGRISRIVVVSRDVTEEKRLQEQFLRAQRMESIGTLAAGIAHDLNNVLAPIMMAIEILRSKTSDPAGQKMLDTIETSAKRGSHIIRQVLAFGRGVKGDHIVLQLKHVANEVVKIAEETFSKSIEVRTDIPKNLWTVTADPTQMHQVLLNMMVNARDAMPHGGILTLSAENIELDVNYSRMHLEAKPGFYVAIAITDTGTGIPASLQGKVFEPFFTTKEIGQGTGLGLSTTLAIVRSHGGFINLYSEEGKGTTFRIYLPAPGTASTETEADIKADLPTGNGELILIIDDEAAIREITKETLEAFGYKAMAAKDGAEGIALYARHRRDIRAVITDIMMPVMDGTATIHALQKMNPEVKIIAASGLTSNDHAAQTSGFTVQAFLTKPYTAAKLLHALADVLRGG